MTTPDPDEQSGTGSTLLRGRSDRSKKLIGAMFGICKEMQPIQGRGVGYKLFTRSLIPSMSRNDMKPVYRLLRQAREEGIIPWHWVVDETREMERTAQWDDPEQFLDCVMRQYRRDFWEQQLNRCEVWSEKGTVRGVLRPVLDEYGVGFRVLHGFSGATTVHDVAQDYDSRILNVIYVGDFDPSGLYMSEVDLPRRLEQYGGDHVFIDRVAITISDTEDLPSFPVSSKKKDPRFKWWTDNDYGKKCWELDAMDPRDLRDKVENAIRELIEPKAWERCVQVNDAERASLMDLTKAFNKPNGNGRRRSRSR